jgi:putative FmdB family regulatory protein
MPIYEYECSDCGKVNEFIINVGRNSDVLKCSSCGGEKLEKMISAANHSMGFSAGSAAPAGSTCCGSTPGVKGCSPGQCCGAG